MITPKDYIDSIEELLHAAFPGEKVYRDLAPEGFDRPSNMIECASFTAEQAGGFALKLDVKLIIRTFVTVDAYHNSQFDALYRRSMAILALFAKGYIRVTDQDTGEKRAPKISAMAVPVTGKDFAEIHLKATMQISTSEMLDMAHFFAARVLTFWGPFARFLFYRKQAIVY